MNWIRIFDREIIQQPDFVTAAHIQGKKLCIIKSGPQIFVTQRKCPHAGADLSQGWCKKEKLICPHHRYQYDLHTGRGAEGQGDAIRIYPVENRPDGIYVGFEEQRTFFEKLFG